MNKNYLNFKLAAFSLAALMLITSCASTTLIQSVPPGAEVYLNNVHVGTTPYPMTDTKITGTCTYVRLEKEGYEALHTDICRMEDVDVGAVIGGIICWVPFLWTMKYYQNHTYELFPLTASEENNAPVIEAPSSKAEKLRELKQLLDEGIITQEEFDAEKKKILEEN